MNLKNIPVDPIIAQRRYDIKIGDTERETKNNMMDVKQEIPTARPSIPSIMLNILIIIIIQTCVMINDIIGEKKIGVEFNGQVINSILMPLKNIPVITIDCSKILSQG